MSEQGTAPAFRTGTPATATITCHEFPKKHLQVTPGDLHVNTDLNETATWECPDGNPFTIVFTSETPFDGWVYNQPSAKNLRPRRDAAHKRPFKYLVAIEGYPPLDPNLIVDP
jgi:hypothetical protein